MIISRKEAIKFASIIKMLDLTQEERQKETINALSEMELENASAVKENIFLRKYLEQKFRYYSNEYLRSFLARFNSSLKIDGPEIKLYSCFCCNYNTLKQRGQYFICDVCYWEDDGNFNEEIFSTVNGMTLKEAKNNFKKIGVISEKFLGSVDIERMSKYVKGRFAI